MADSDDTVARPADWDKAVAAAYLRLIGASQAAAARGAGAGERTVARWEKSAFWHEACEEASDRWLNHLVAASRRSLAKGVDGDPGLALKVIERVDVRLAPPKLQAELSGPEGGPIPTEARITFVDAAAADGSGSEDG